MEENEELELLSTEEIEAMNAYLKEHPPLVGPPPDLPFFDVRRMAATLLFLTTRVDNEARRSNTLVKERDEARQLAAQLFWGMPMDRAQEAETIGKHPWLADYAPEWWKENGQLLVDGWTPSFGDGSV